MRSCGGGEPTPQFTTRIDTIPNARNTRVQHDGMTHGVEREFNLRPHPRILPMLGEINLDVWKCVAELIDNAVDSFMAAVREEQPVDRPEVVVSLPTIDKRGAVVSVRDNGPGMDAERLEKAVKAGWTGNDPVNHLGVFGMGFNIATARLGRLTRVWSTRKQDREWYGLEIDFAQLIEQSHFRTPMRTRPKVHGGEQGTEIIIERLKPDQATWLAKSANRGTVNRHLERAYSSMLRPDGVPVPVSIQVNTRRLNGHRHCVWGDPQTSSDPRFVTHHRYGPIDVFQPVDKTLGERRYCVDCWLWLGSGGDDVSVVWYRRWRLCA